MNGWLDFLGYQAVWFVAVIAAGHGAAWPGVAAAAAFVLARLLVSPSPAAQLRLLAAALLAGTAIDGGLAWTGLAGYAAAWPSPHMAPAWILGLWCAFASTLPNSLRMLQTRLGLAALLGAIGAPLAYLGAARGWNAVALAEPAWRGWLWLTLGWAAALPLLAITSRRIAPLGRNACAERAT